MFDSFNAQSKLIKVILLLIPFVNWITELVTRWDLHSKKKDTPRLIVAILVIFPIGVIVGFIDLISVILTDKMCLVD